jgi:hypothetical protein
MVIDKGAKNVFDITVQNGKRLEQFGNALFLVGVALELRKNMRTLNLTADGIGNAQKLLLAPSMAILNVFGGWIPPTAHKIAQTLEYTCGLTGSCGSQQTISTLDYTIQKSYEAMMDPNNVRNYINTHLVFVR